MGPSQDTLTDLANGLRHWSAHVGELVPDGPPMLADWVGARLLRLADELSRLSETDACEMRDELVDGVVRDLTQLAADSHVEGTRVPGITLAAAGVLVRHEALEDGGDGQAF